MYTGSGEGRKQKKRRVEFEIMWKLAASKSWKD